MNCLLYLSQKEIIIFGVCGMKMFVTPWFNQWSYETQEPRFRFQIKNRVKNTAVKKCVE